MAAWSTVKSGVIFHRSHLWLRAAWPFVLFVVIGSLALAVWLESLVRHESVAVFTALARTNAEFLNSARIPESEQTMSYLGRILNMQAFVCLPSGTLRPAPPSALVPYTAQLLALRPAEGLQALGLSDEAIAAPLQGEARLLLVRPKAPTFGFLQRRDTAGALIVFCLLSGTLAAVVSQRIVQTERMALLGKLATGLAHEIHNPLSAIRLHAQLLESAPPEELPTAVAASAPVLVDESGRIEALVNQWMFLARPEPPGVRVLALTPLVERVLRNHRAHAAHARVTLESELTDVVNLNGDERRLSQALGNLVLNAIQALPRGGRVRVSTATVAGGIRLTVADTGTGFSAAALERARELFYSEKEGGMGVGLCVVEEIVVAHGGRLEFENQAGGGATVRVYLPATFSASSPA